ncbi:VOC family protein [Jeotgalibacillus soli]|uniref:VOC family protein n=1 Tax=Jeotgalibacillus soli TaxID=889306 RepID=UPI000A06C75F
MIILKKFDHLVHFIKESVDVPVERLKQKGIHAVIGGIHENWGTQNSLLHAGLSYIEYLTIIDQKKQRKVITH